MKIIFAILLVVMSSLTMALPTPQEVDNAYNSGDYKKTEQMLLEVLQVKSTAKVHFRLAEVYMRQNRPEESLKELLLSKTLDPSLKFVRDPRDFHRMLDSMQALVDAGKPKVVVQEPKISAESQIAIIQATTEAKKVEAQIQEKESESSRTVGFIILLVIVVGVAGIFSYNRSLVNAASRRKQESEDEEAERLALKCKEQLAKLIENNNYINDAELICKTATTTEAQKQAVLTKIDIVQRIIADLIVETKSGNDVSWARVTTTCNTVKDLVAAADAGKLPDPPPEVVKPKPEPIVTRTVVKEAPVSDSPSFTKGSSFTTVIPEKTGSIQDGIARARKLQAEYEARERREEAEKIAAQARRSREQAREREREREEERRREREREEEDNSGDFLAGAILGALADGLSSSGSSSSSSSSSKSWSDDDDSSSKSSSSSSWNDDSSSSKSSSSSSWNDDSSSSSSSSSTNSWD